MLLFDFDKDSVLSNWKIVDDVVMGGRSNGAFHLNESGHGVFHGKISLANNGGFSSVRYQFETTAEWQTIEIPLSDMEPRFRGRILEMPNYPGKVMEEIAFLIGNKKEETFKLQIDWIRIVNRHLLQRKNDPSTSGINSGLKIFRNDSIHEKLSHHRRLFRYRKIACRYARRRWSRGFCHL